MFKIKFDTIEQVKLFVKEMEHLDYDSIIRTVNRQYAVDAKSLMGIFSLDLTDYLLLSVYGDVTGLEDKIKALGIFVEVINEEE